MVPMVVFIRLSTAQMISLCIQQVSILTSRSGIVIVHLNAKKSRAALAKLNIPWLLEHYPGWVLTSALALDNLLTPVTNTCYLLVLSKKPFQPVLVAGLPYSRNV